MIELLNMDCMDYMKEQPDKSFDLAIVDPPYGIGESGSNNSSRTKPFGSRVDGKNTKGTEVKAVSYKPFAGLDKTPPPIEYFMELLRISNNQIIWGANHFVQMIGQGSPCWIVWDKVNSGDFADCELAYTSFKTAVRKFTFKWNGMLQQDMKNKEIRIHPTQKPMRLYQWILENYAEPGQRILDTHLGSGSSAIAAHYFGVDFVGIEIDEDYYKAAVERFNNETAQETLF